MIWITIHASQLYYIIRLIHCAFFLNVSRIFFFLVIFLIQIEAIELNAYTVALRLTYPHHVNKLLICFIFAID